MKLKMLAMPLALVSVMALGACATKPAATDAPDVNSTEPIAPDSTTTPGSTMPDSTTSPSSTTTTPDSTMTMPDSTMPDSTTTSPDSTTTTPGSSN